ncbi:unnamed protein product [Lasius platythorax]|uniref:Uncharacterized protein n=1 Tax=Lasius platythorax TaxID=488582 RepID=A0AAV2NBJ2_9HYME
MKKLRKRREPATRPNALIIRMEDKKKYSEMLKRVKKDVPRDQVGDCVDKIRKTITGDMLIVLTKENTDKAPGLQKAIADLLGEEAQVVSKVQEEDLEIKDLDKTTTNEKRSSKRYKTQLERTAKSQRTRSSLCGRRTREPKLPPLD